MMRRQMQSAYSSGNPSEPIPFYRIDEVTKTVAILAREEAHQQMQDVIEKLGALSDQELKTTSKVYRLDSMIGTQLQAAISSIFPTCVPYAFSSYEVFVYGPSSELEKVDEFVKTLTEDNKFDKNRRGMRLFQLPEEAKYNRDRMVNIINSNFASQGISAYQGAVANQIIVWGLPTTLDQVGKFIDEITSVPNDAVYKTYPIAHADITTTVTFLAKVCPNLEISPDVARRQIIVFGTPLQHASIEKALEAFDQPIDESVQSVVNTYAWDDYASYWSVYAELRANFPGYIITSSTDQGYVVSAPVQIQEKIGQYLHSRRLNQVDLGLRLETYYLERVTYTKLVQISPILLPTVSVYPGKGANEIFVIASPSNHYRFKQMLAQLESAPENGGEFGIEPKIYKVSPGAASTTVALVQPQLPGVVMYPLSGDRLVVWGGKADHEYVERALDTIAEAFPTVELKKYQLHYLRIADVISFLQTRFATEGQFYASTSGDLMSVAIPQVQEKVASMLSELDVEEAEDSRYIPTAYDISDIPVASLPSAG